MKENLNSYILMNYRKLRKKEKKKIMQEEEEKKNTYTIYIYLGY